MYLSHTQRPYFQSKQWLPDG